MNTLRHLLAWSIPLLVLSALAATVIAAGGFSHGPHVGEAACADCHATASNQPTAGMPARETCQGCHDEGSVDTAFLDAPRTTPANSLAFSHKAHAGLDCADCHGDMKQESKVPGVKQCQDCHRDNDIKTAGCIACHQQARFTPAYHGGNWQRLHGGKSGLAVTTAHGHDCAACHSDDSCTSCHKSTRPRSHTGLWRTRTHGFRAAIDRESCATCHEEAGCVRCHRSVKPVNHRGSWSMLHGRTLTGGFSGATDSCAVCHHDSDCTTCHKQ